MPELATPIPILTTTVLERAAGDIPGGLSVKSARRLFGGHAGLAPGVDAARGAEKCQAGTYVKYGIMRVTCHRRLVAGAVSLQ